MILFKSDVSGRIERVPASGGRPTPVTIVDPSRGEFWLSWPQFLPDGRHFLYFVMSSQSEFAGIYVASLDGPDRTRVLGDYSQALYVQPGYLMFHREGTLLVQRFDAATLKLSGDALPLARDVAFNSGTRRGVFSASATGVLAYNTAEDTVLSWFDRDGTALGTIGPPGHYRDPVISPDGRTVAVARWDSRVEMDNIWLIDSNNGAATRFTFDPHGDTKPTWSRDGTRIVFSSRRGAKEDLYVKSLAGATSEELLLSMSQPVSPLDWSPDGRFLMFMGPGRGTHREMWVLPLVGERKPFTITETAANEGQGRLSPDGRWLAYTDLTGSRSSTGQDPGEVYVRPFPRTAAGKWRISDYGGGQPQWRRDGKELFYLSADQRLMVARVRATSSFEADLPTALFETRAVGVQLGTNQNQYDVAPDGRRFLINVPTSGSSKPITVVNNWPATLPH